MRRARIAASDPAPQAGFRLCEAPGCAGAGEYRAPRSRASLDQYFWFCLSHVREYNAAWNYYAGMSDLEIEAEIRRDTTWQRPSWPLGARIGTIHGRMRDHFGIFGEGAHHEKRQEKQQRRPLTEQERALAVFDIEAPFTLVRLKARYKELVKLNHPDLHGGDKDAEERLKAINQAYSTLKTCYFS